MCLAFFLWLFLAAAGIWLFGLVARFGSGEDNDQRK